MEKEKLKVWEKNEIRKIKVQAGLKEDRKKRVRE